MYLNVYMQVNELAFHKFCVWHFVFQTEFDQYASALQDVGANLNPLNYIRKWKYVWITRHSLTAESLRKQFVYKIWILFIFL